MLAVGLGPVVIYELLQLLHLSDQGLYIYSQWLQWFRSGSPNA